MRNLSREDFNLAWAELGEFVGRKTQSTNRGNAMRKVTSLQGWLTEIRPGWRIKSANPMYASIDDYPPNPRLAVSHMSERLERSWLKDALDKALREDLDKPSPVQQFAAAILHGNTIETATQYRGLQKSNAA